MNPALILAIATLVSAVSTLLGLFVHNKNKHNGTS